MSIDVVKLPGQVDSGVTPFYKCLMLGLRIPQDESNTNMYSFDLYVGQSLPIYNALLLCSRAAASR